MKIKKDTVLKTLISLGILAIISSLYVQYGKSYLKEVSFERQDQVRIKDLDTLNNIFKDITLASSTQLLGKNNTIYISIPSDNSTCSNLDLPSVPDGWAYHCSNQADYQKTDGSGWIPVNISGKVKQLPLDPINKAETLNYYAYVASSSEYVVTGALDSKKYWGEKTKSDNGTDDIRYEVGNNLKLWGEAGGLIGYWPIDEGAGSLVSDKSTHNNSAQIQNLQKWEGSTLHFDGNNYVKIIDSKILDKIGQKDFNYSLLVSFKSSVNKDQSITEKWIGNTYPFSIRGPYPGIRFSIYDGKQNPVIASESTYSDFQWHQILAGRDTKNKSIFMYTDGKLIGVSLDDTVNDISNKGSFPIGARNINGSNSFNGYIRGLYIFNRVLNSEEAKRIYSSEKY